MAGVAEVHEMKLEGDVMKMRALPGLDLPAGKAVELKPGGYHLMLMDLKPAPLAEGADAGTLRLPTPKAWRPAGTEVAGRAPRRRVVTLRRAARGAQAPGLKALAAFAGPKRRYTVARLTPRALAACSTLLRVADRLADQRGFEFLERPPESPGGGILQGSGLGLAARQHRQRMQA